MNHTCDSRQYELHPPHLINVATLPCENQNTKNVTLQRVLPMKIASDVSYFIKVDQGHHVPEIYLHGCYTVKHT